MKLSIIVPVYNTEEYVCRCLESLFSASELQDEFEVIVIDDGSTDRSPSMIAQYAWKNNFRQISQNNAGLGAARNTGIDMARGDYVWFMDSDDFVLPRAIEGILQELEQYSPDVLITRFRCSDESGNEIKWISDNITLRGETTTGEQFFLENYRWSYAALYICRRSILVQNNLRFQPRINMQDAELMPRILHKAKVVRVSLAQTYVYVKRGNSFVNSTQREVREKYFKSVIEVFERLTQFRSTLQRSNLLMIRGSELKLAAISEILLFSYLYESGSPDAARTRLDALRRSRAFPFQLDPSNKTRFKQLLVLLTNAAPTLFFRIFATLRHLKQTLRNA